MEWTSIDVESDKDIREEVGGLADLKVGLDTDAESMHPGVHERPASPI
ncbi:MAG: hypothetical protein Ct9H90mP24_7980 [Methanobacteriota archaeon]|nr:MAG: hypothetical protein Ct9H90mP24_7980 [Euryarchaeota archaeon]